LEVIFMDLSREWMEDQIIKLAMELVESERRKAEAKTQLDKAKAEYAAAREAVEEASGLIRYFRGEIKIQIRNEELMDEVEAGK
jgi:hypothetical protein